MEKNIIIDNLKAQGINVSEIDLQIASVISSFVEKTAIKIKKDYDGYEMDEIVGFVTRGRGVTIHRTDCVNVLNFPQSERERLIDAEWEETRAGDTYSAEINIFANNRTGLIVDISRILTEANIEIKMMNSRVNKKGVATITLGFDIHGKEELSKISDKLHKVEEVTDIVRATG